MNFKKHLADIPILLGYLLIFFVIFTGAWALLSPATFTERLITLIVAAISGVVGEQLAFHIIRETLETVAELHARSARDRDSYSRAR